MSNPTKTSRTRLCNLSATLFAMICAMALSLSGAECVWTGASGAWGSSAGWQNGVKPSAAGDTVVIKGDNVAVTVGDADIANFELVTEITVEGTGSQIIVDTSSIVSTPAVFSGKGALVKKGTSLMNLTNPGSGYRTLLGELSGGIIVSNGTVQLPNRTKSIGYDNDQLEFSRVEVSGAGILSLGNSKYFSVTKGLWGDGTITNANTGCELYLYCNDYSNPPVFSGRLMPAIQFTPFFFGGKPSIQYMTGSSIDFNMTLRNYGIVGVKKFGNVDEAGSLGTGILYFRGGYSCLRCLNEEDEITSKHLGFQPDGKLATLDAGARGGVTFNGEWYLPAYTGLGNPSDPNSWKYNTIVLTGDNTNKPNTIAASMYDQTVRSTVYWRKEGIGIWRFAGNGSGRSILGTMEVRRGTLQSETLAEKGTICSVGYATRTGPDVSGLSDADRVSNNVPLVAYAFRLGNSLAAPLTVTNEFLPTFEYVGANPGTCKTRPFVVDGVGRIQSTGGTLTLAGASAFTNGVHTLVLDGATSTTNLFSSVTNGTLGTLNVVKRGGGVWRLSRDIDVGAVSAEQGVLEIGSRYSFYRWTITANNQGAGGKWIASFNGFALMDKAGNIVNGTLGANGMASKNTRPDLLLPGEMCYQKAYASTGNRYPSKSFHWLPDQNKFEGAAAAIDVTVNKTDASTHPIVYFRPDEGVDVAKYDILADGNTERAVAQWELAGSMDGLAWDVLHTVNDSNMQTMPMTANTWYSDKGSGAVPSKGFDIAVGDTNSTMRVTSVCAAQGATVVFIGNASETVISNIVIDVQKGAGTIRGGNLAAGGTVEILNAESMQGLPSYVFDGVGDYANISRWSVTCDGRQTHWASQPNADGSGFSIVPKGLSIVIR